MRNYQKIVFSILLASLLISCGFHLRGKINIPEKWQPLYLESQQPYAPFEKILHQSLLASDVRLVPSSTNANSVLQILNTHLTRSVTNTSANAQTQTVQLHYRVSYQILHRNRIVFGPKTIAISRSYTANTGQMLGANAQEVNLVQTMHQQAAFLIFNQLSSKEAQQAFIKSQ